MKLQVLDKKSFPKKDTTWYLCKGNLYEFLKSLKKDFYEYQIQRRIVRNVYLDGLSQTIKEGTPIPPITLTAAQVYNPVDGMIEIRPESGSVDILDGLQRTFRLWIFLDLYKKVTEQHLTSYKELILLLKSNEENARILNLDFVNSTYLKIFFEEEKVEEILEAYKRYDIYLAVWTNLSDAEIIKKMLVLNAGQRPVSSTHQYELLFLHYFDNNKLDIGGIQIFREKDSGYFHVHRGVREVGQYTMASIIIALQSFMEHKPLRVVPANYIELDTDALSTEKTESYFNPEFLNKFINDIYRLDKALAIKDERFVKWYGKDTTLSGIFAALGDRKIDVADLLTRINNNRFDFRLDKFNQEYDQLASTKVNVGRVVRNAIYQYSCDELEGGWGNWKEAFNNKDAYGTW